MKDFQRGGWKKSGSGSGNSFGGRPKFGGFNKSRGGFGDRDDRPEMHDAVCNACGAECQVPFRPNGRKPIYCNNCFKRDESESTQRFGGNSNFENTSYAVKRPSFAKPAPSADYSKELKAINAKLDAILSILNSAVEGEDEGEEGEADENES